jgi:hypothetical protein
MTLADDGTRKKSHRSFSAVGAPFCLSSQLTHPGNPHEISSRKYTSFEVVCNTIPLIPPSLSATNLRLFSPPNTRALRRLFLRVSSLRPILGAVLMFPHQRRELFLYLYYEVKRSFGGKYQTESDSWNALVIVDKPRDIDRA